MTQSHPRALLIESITNDMPNKTEKEENTRVQMGESNKIYKIKQRNILFKLRIS